MNLIKKVKIQSIDLGVPLIRDDMAEFLRTQIKEHKPQHILEIGTGIGYSAIVMASAMNETGFDYELITIEKNEERAKHAAGNFCGYSHKYDIKLVVGDAKDFLKSAIEKKWVFDFIFLDGPKAQYVNYLEDIVTLMSSGGILVADNIYCKANPKLAEKLKKFVEAAKAHKDLKDVRIENIADGVLIATKK